MFIRRSTFFALFLGSILLLFIFFATVPVDEVPMGLLDAAHNDINARLDMLINLTSNTEDEYKRLRKEMNTFQKSLELSPQDQVEYSGKSRMLFESVVLGRLVQRRIQYIQNPANCTAAEKFVCNLDKNCGLGCQIHHLVYCLITGYATRRTMILRTEGWRYSSHDTGGWEKLYLPVSDTCASIDPSSKDINVLPIVDDLPLPYPDYLPRNIPDDLADRIRNFHGEPAVWWISQFVKYLLRPQTYLKEFLKDSKKRFSFDNPVVGVHVRRTDKLISEAKYYNVDEYMVHVGKWFDAYEKENSSVAQRKVYLATDDPSVLPEITKKYPGYTFISDHKTSKSANPRERYTGLMDLIRDLYLLSSCDYVVCTFSSQICRLVNELLQQRHIDGSDRVKSLDYRFYFGGENQPTVKRVKMPTYPEVKDYNFESVVFGE